MIATGQTRRMPVLLVLFSAVDMVKIVACSDVVVVDKNSNCSLPASHGRGCSAQPVSRTMVF